MRMFLTSVALMVGLLTNLMAASTPKMDRFYGKITAVNSAQKTLTVFNKKQQSEATFSWNGETAFTNNKQPMQPQDLAVGQFLMVSYQGEGDNRVAAKVAVRPLPGKKKTTQ